MAGTAVVRHMLLRTLACTALLGLAGVAWAGGEEDARARNAIRVMTDIQAIPESAIPDKLLDEARAVVVVPDTIKAGLVLGGRRGHGLMAVKTREGTWSNPVFVKLTGGSIGFQAGVQSSDIVLAFRTDRGLESIVNGKFTLGADAGVAAGPMGRNASTATDGELKAEIWSWSRARGLFAGVALDGAVLSIDDDANAAVYGPGITPRMILEGRIAEPPSAAVVDFRDLLEEATATARARRGTEGTVAARNGTRVDANAPLPPPPPDDAYADPALPAAETQPADGTVPAEQQPSTFEPVENEPVENPAQVEPLPPIP
jgi:lipid-binding SYLF domain-containing protein